LKSRLWKGPPPVLQTAFCTWRRRCRLFNLWFFPFDPVRHRFSRGWFNSSSSDN
jgi:hypothetical protein